MNKYRPHNTSPDQRGFTLLESMIAILVLGIGVLSILQFLTGSIKSNTLNNPRAVAVHNAGEQLVELYRAAATGPTEIEKSLNELIKGISPADSKYKYKVTAVAAVDNKNRKIITDSKTVDTDTGKWSSPITLGINIHYEVNGEIFDILVPQTLVFGDS